MTKKQKGWQLLEEYFEENFGIARKKIQKKEKQTKKRDPKK